MLDALREVRDNLTYARSEVYSAYEEVPDYDCNSSGRSYISQADSYLDRAADDLDKVIESFAKARNLELRIWQETPLIVKKGWY